MGAPQAADGAEADPGGDQHGDQPQQREQREADRDDHQADVAPLAQLQHGSEGMLRTMPTRGPTELLILFQLALAAGFAGMLVWMLLKWAGAL